MIQCITTFSYKMASLYLKNTGFNSLTKNSSQWCKNDVRQSVEIPLGFGIAITGKALMFACMTK